jgi:hypothetical protein
LAYNSVLTKVRTLEKMGHVNHVKDGPAHVYEPIIGRQEATRSEIRHLVGRVFRIRQTFVILQTVQYDASGSGVWTLSILRIGETQEAVAVSHCAKFNLRELFLFLPTKQLVATKGE